MLLATAELTQDIKGFMGKVIQILCQKTPKGKIYILEAGYNNMI